MVITLPGQMKRSGWGSIGAGLGKGLGEGLEQHIDEKKLLDIQRQENDGAKRLGIDLSGIRDKDTRKSLMLQSLKLHEQGNKSASDLLKNKNILNDLEKRRNLEPGSLSAYEDDPSMAERISRPEKPRQKRLSEQPIDPEQKKSLKIARSSPGFDEMDEVDQYRTMVDNGVSPELAEKESKLTSSKLERNQKSFDKSYDSQKDFIEETTNKYKSFETEMKPRLMQLQKLASDEELIGPTAASFLETVGIPLGALEDPSSELYQKTSLDLLKGLPESFGNRIMKVEVDNFLNTIPRLVNSPEGRRMIASNILKLGEMKEVYYKEMRKQQKDALDKNKFPRDFQQSVFDQVKPQIDRINNEFVKMSEIKSVPKGTIPFFTPSGQIKFIPKDKVQQAMEKGGRRIW